MQIKKNTGLGKYLKAFLSQAGRQAAGVLPRLLESISLPGNQLGRVVLK